MQVSTHIPAQTSVSFDGIFPIRVAVVASFWKVARFFLPPLRSVLPNIAPFFGGQSLLSNRSTR